LARTLAAWVALERNCGRDHA